MAVHTTKMLNNHLVIEPEGLTPPSLNTATGHDPKPVPSISHSEQFFSKVHPPIFFLTISMVLSPEPG
jgi:hypothetical protein